MISIIIPIYNQASKLRKCLDSILNQNYKDFEVIIVNDGSTDNVNEVVKSYQSKLLITNYQLPKNQGAPATRNFGFSKSKGEFLFFCDADSILEPECLKIMLVVLDEHTEASYVYSSFRWGRKLFKLWQFDALKLREMPYVHTMSLIRRKHFPSRGWDNNIKKLNDWDLWLTMLEQGHTGFWIDKVLFTVSPGGTMSSWLPSFAYKLLPFLPSVKKYNNAIEIVKRKHNLDNKEY